MFLLKTAGYLGDLHHLTVVSIPDKKVYWVAWLLGLLS